MRTLKAKAVFFVILLAAVCMAQDSSVILNDSRVTKQVTLNHATLFAVNGDRNVLTVNGDCDAFMLRGRQNKVIFNGAVGSVVIPGKFNIVEFNGPVQDIKVGGIANELTSRKEADKALHVEVTGDGNLLHWYHSGHKDPPDWHDLGDKNKLLPMP